MKGPDKPKWTRVMENDIGSLFQVIGDIKGTDACLFIHRHEVPQDSKFTYSRIVCNIIPQKKETHILRLIVGGNKLTYNDPVSIPTSDSTMAKIHWNSVLSTSDGKYLILYVKNFYLNNPMMKSEYYKIAIKLIPHEIIDKYDLNNNKSYSYIYVIFEELIYGLVQAGVKTHIISRIV